MNARQRRAGEIQRRRLREIADESRRVASWSRSTGIRVAVLSARLDAYDKAHALLAMPPGADAGYIQASLEQAEQERTAVERRAAMHLV